MSRNWVSMEAFSANPGLAQRLRQKLEQQVFDAGSAFTFGWYDDCYHGNDIGNHIFV